MTYSYLPPKRISELLLVTDINDNNLFVLSQDNNNSTKAVSFNTLKNKILNLVNTGSSSIDINETAPADPIINKLWGRLSNKELRVWDGSQWNLYLKDFTEQNLESAKNINVTSLRDGACLLWNSDTSKWILSPSNPLLVSTYDSNNNGIVDNAETLLGNSPTFYLNRLNHTGKLPLIDLASGSATLNQILSFDGNSWTPQNNTLISLFDVNIPSLPNNNNSVLFWNNTTSKFVLSPTTDKGHDILFNNVPVTVRSILDYTGELVTVTDNNVLNKTVVNIELPTSVVRWNQIDSNNNNIIDLAETANIANAVNWTNVTNKPNFVENLNDLIDVTITPNPTIGDSGKALTWDGTKYILSIPIDQNPGHQILSNSTLLTQRTKLNFKGNGVVVTDNSATGSTDIDITASPGEISTASNLGTGFNIFQSKQGVDFRFRSLKAGSGISLSFINSNNEIEITRNALSTSDIPNLDTSKITTGILALSLLPTIPNTQISGLGTASTRNVPLTGNASTTEIVLGDDTRLTDSRTPQGNAGGDLTGTFPNPNINNQAITFSKLQNITAGKFLVRHSNTNGTVQEGSFSTGLNLDTVTGNLTVEASQINHNLLSNYVVNQHIDHSTISITAGNGLTGGGNLTVNRTLALGTPSTLTAATSNSSSGSTHTHQITGFTPTTRTITTSTGLTGGGDLSANRTLSLTNTTVTAGSYTLGNFTVDAQGRLTAASSTSILPIENGGTGSNTQNFVDLTNNQNIAGVKTFTGGELNLNNSTANILNFNSLGFGGPTFNTRSPGTKIVIWNSLSSTNTDYAIGLEGNHMWFSIPSLNNPVQGFKWYSRDSQIARLNGTGILETNGFRPTNIDSTDTQVLDHYNDNQSFTPALVGSTTVGSFIYSQQVGRFTRIGNTVFFTIVLVSTGTTVAPAGNLRISGLPFTSANISGNNSSVIVYFFSGLTAGVTPPILGLTLNNNNLLFLYRNTGVLLSAADVAAPFNVQISGFYFI